MSYCVEDGCYKQRVAGSKHCTTHCVELATYGGLDLTPLEQAEIVASKLEKVARQRTRLQAIGTTGLAVAASAVTIGMGAGALGVVFVAGVAVGLFALAKSV